MKYFTKEWYNRMQSTGMHMLLRKDERCSALSVELFSELYDKEREQYLKIMAFCEDFNEFSNLMNGIDGAYKDLSESEQRLRFDEFRKEELGGLSLSDKFDKKLSVSMNGLAEKLPDEIIKKVADLRVLALGYASEDIYNKIEELSNYNQRFVEEKLKLYTEHIINNFSGGLKFLDENFHDSYVDKVEVNGSDLVISLDSVGEGTKKVTFKNFEIILDEGIVNSYWLYEEVYRDGNDLEIHILVSGTEGLKEMIVKCSEAVVE